MRTPEEVEKQFIEDFECTFVGLQHFIKQIQHESFTAGFEQCKRMAVEKCVEGSFEQREVSLLQPDLGK